jgi:hypothetical protein
MPRGAKPGGITIGFLGTGVKAVDPATDLIEEYINSTVPDPDDPARFIFPLTTDEFSDSMADLARMAKKSRIDYEVISLTGDRNRRLFTEVAQAAVKQYYVTDVWTQMEMILAEAPQAAVFVLWDDQREQELADICAKFMDADIPVLDLTNNLIPLSKDEEEEGEAIDAESYEVGAEEAVNDEETQAEAEEEEPEEPEGTPAAYDGLGYTRTQLEQMTHAQVKDIAVGMGLAPRKARENMIIAILEKQGTPDTAPVASVRPQTAPVIPASVELLEGFGKALDDFGNRFFTGLDEWLTKFSQAAEGFAFNTSPEEPMAVQAEEEQEPPRRRLSRAR